MSRMSSKQPSSQRGVAVVTALLVAALATLAVTGVMWRQQVQARSVENQIALAETRWLARGAIDWARVMLTYDRSRSTVDHLGEFWAVPIADTKVADPQDGLREGYLSGQITDEQSKYDLHNLATAGVVDEAKELPKFVRLLEALGIDAPLGPAIAQAIADTQARIGADGNLVPPSALPMLVVDDLARVAGVEAGAIERLRPFVAFLPRPGTATVPVNANTAGAEVLHATIAALSLQQAQMLIGKREARTNFNSTGEIENDARSLGVDLAGELSGIAVKSNYFRIQGRIRYDRALVNLEALVYRLDSGGSTRVLWQQEN